MYYFAYGSNMNHAQMLKRCPDSRFITKSFLKEFQFIYDGKSFTWSGKSVANIIEAKNSIVWGGLYEISSADLVKLNKYEGYPRSYNRKQVSVCDASGTHYEAWVYFRTGQQQGEPSDKYRDVVLKGAKDCLLPDNYINNCLLENHL